MIKRKTNLKTIWQRAKIRPILSLFAFQGIAFSLFLFIPIAFIMNSMKSGYPYLKNADEIMSNGTIERAVVVDIEPIENVSINGNNPQILTYEFLIDEQKYKSKFSVFEPYKTNELKIGDSLKIKYLNGESAPIEFEQYSLGMDFIYYVAGASLFIGLIFCYMLYVRIEKEISLYKSGRLKEGIVISISQNYGFTFSKFGKSMDVHYEYQNRIYKSRTNNFAQTNNKSVGDSIKILVSDDGKDSCLYPILIAKSNDWD